MLPILQIGPFAVQLPGLLLLAGVWIGTLMVEREAPRYKLSEATLSNMIFLGLVAGIVGGRLWYALRFLDVYLESPLGLISLNPSTIAPTEGVLTGLLAASIYGQRKGLPLWPTMDALAPSFAVFAVAVGLSHIASGDAFGAPTSIPWAINLWGAERHPSQFYETAAALLILVVIMRLRGRLAPGALWTTWVSLTAASRLLLERFRGDSVIILDSLRSAQVVSLIVLLAAMLALHLLTLRQPIRSKRRRG